MQDDNDRKIEAEDNKPIDDKEPLTNDAIIFPEEEHSLNISYINQKDTNHKHEDNLNIKKDRKSLFSNEKTRKRNLILVILSIFVLMCGFGVLAGISINNILNNVSKSTSGNYSNEIEGKNIFLRKNATDLQKDLFKQLKQAYADEDDEEAAKLTAESFIADFYTWTNKYGSYDVGGIYYCCDRFNTELYGRDTFYKYVTYYIDKYGSENLLEVISINAEGGHVDGAKYKLSYDEQEYEQYYFRVTWEYADHPGFTKKEYCSSNTIVVIKSATGRFEIVEAYGDN